MSPRRRSGPRYGPSAIIEPCPRCGRHVLAVRQRDEGWVSRADPENLTRTAEIVAILQRRFTWDVRDDGYAAGIELVHRGTFELRAPRKYPVVAAHICGTVLEYEPPPAPEFPRPPPYIIPDEPPF